jgi:hypothetical protein
MHQTLKKLSKMLTLYLTSFSYPILDAFALEQNPVEDVWLQAKNFLRKYWHLCKSFSVIKWLFKFFTHHQKFDFPKLHQYAPCL